jgi:hypothetical protein
MSANSIKAQRQDYSTHEFSVFILGGISNINSKFKEVSPDVNGRELEILGSQYYHFSKAKRNGGFGGGIGFNYIYNIDEQFAIVTGLEFLTYASKLQIDESSEEYLSTDYDGDEFILKYFLEKYNEKQTAVIFSIPLMVKYTTPFPNSSIKYFVSGGLKLGFPFSAKATITPGAVSTAGYYEFEDRLYKNLWEHGFINGAPGDQTKSNIKLGVAAIISVETGVRIPISFSKDLILGVYLNYNPNSIQKINNNHVLEYQSLTPDVFIYKSALNSGMIKNVNLFSTGLKVGIKF